VLLLMWSELARRSEASLLVLLVVLQEVLKLILKPGCGAVGSCCWSSK
jgi:hypothetical protein